jgi:voltage-gated potassium channel Kch
MSAFQYCEVTFGEVHYSILDSLYVVMVTLSTVGYGDITPSTEGSRVIMMLLIVISLAALPSLLADVLNTVRKRSGNKMDSIPCFIHVAYFISSF